MRVLLSTVAVTLVLLCSACPGLGQTAGGAKGKKVHQWWKDRYPGEPLKSPNATKLPLISVRGNKFVDSQGATVLFRGLSISDPDKIENQGHWNKEHFVKVQQTGARLVRIPVHPIAWRERTPEKYLALLDLAVEWCTELGMYVDIDWHSIGNLNAQLFQDPMYQTSPAETFNFWRVVARHYAGNHTVAFYELFNEPTSYSGQLGRVSWDEWKRTNEDLIAFIRAYDREKIPLVAGFDWAYDLTPLHERPIEAEGIGYVTHPYPFKRAKPWESKWDEDFGFAAGRYPIIATEIGFWTGPGANPEYADYGPAIVKYLESRGISWVAWVFDPEWDPSLIASWDTYAPTECGKFFSEAMQGKVQ
ncbi:MAG: cellulase family glycosylhydrolase [Candidatus Acidiferrum sp.]